ncbi:phosphonate monoester hydrolase [Rhodobacterales bacterium 52_120_T64]|nr:phosphonate monoester hydrolase [Rhodobacterales bacterium 52_120_T64]
MSKKRKILVIISDQLRADCVEGALEKHIKMPNIAALRKDAVTFTKHFSVTNPCGPSRASIFTGMYAMNHRSIRNGTPMSDGITNIAREMRKSGYDPMLYGYTDASLDPRTRHPNDPDLKTEENLLPGFREVLEMRFMESYPWRAYLTSKGYDVPDYAKFYDAISPDPARPARPDDPPFYKAEDSDTAFLTNSLIHDLSVRTDQDWFAVATYIRPHPPLVAPEPYNKMYDPAELPKPARLGSSATQTDVHPFMAGALKAPKMESVVRGCVVDAENDDDVQMLRSIYLGLATEVDTHIGRIIDFLKETGQYDDTIIVLMADHGESLGDHHLWGKQNPYEGAYHIPLIIRDPQNPAQHGTVVDAFTESVDFTPTVLDLVGQAVPAGMDGVSLKPFLEGTPPEKWRDAVHLELEFSEPHTTTEWQKATGVSLHEANLAILREERYKLVHFNGGLPPLMFDLKNDPNELVNIADDAAHAGTLLRLTQKLLNHRMRHSDRTLADVKITSEGVVNFTP